MVCGDKALGYNFNAITCESCKAFFRRNALLTKEFTCPFSQNCEITVITRRFCQRCRLEKCFQIGMKKEHIMSEEDKIRKKRKIEQNRAKRKLVSVTQADGTIVEKIKRESEPALDSWPDRDENCTNSEYGGTSPCDLSNSNMSFESRLDKNTEVLLPSTVSSTTESQSLPDRTSSAEELVNSIVSPPENAGRVINHLMKTPTDAVDILTKIINSPSEAMILISHLISYPGDALKIISKIMNSPFDALTVFTKFMSSPTDALEIITKIVNSPSDVLQFIQQLMNSPEDALEIMNKFIRSPAEALRLINKMVNSKADSTTETCEPNQQAKDASQSYSMINAVLNGVQSPNSPSMPQSPEQINLSTQNETKFGTSTITTPQPDISENTEIPTPPNSETQNSFSDIAEESAANVSGITQTAPESLKNILEDVEDRPIQPNSIESVLCEAIKLEYETYNSLPQFCGESRELNEAEQAKLTELIVANKALLHPLDDDLTNIIDEDGRLKCDANTRDPQLLNVINLTAVAIRRLIKMSKKIGAFRNMCQEDQIALLKGGCTEMMIMRSVMSYDCDRATWKIPHSKESMSNLRVDILKLAKGNIYEEHDRFIRTFDPRWRMDENIILIMCAIVLFTPTRPRVIHSDVIKLEQNSYYYLLRRYLESVYPGCEAKSTFIKLIQKISEVRTLNEVVIGVYLNVNPSQVEPLLREIFDIKNH